MKSQNPRGLWSGNTVQEVLEKNPCFEETARTKFGHLSHDELLREIASGMVREHRRTENGANLIRGVHAAYEAVCGKKYPGGNYACDQLVLLRLITERAGAMRAKLEEWIRPCFCEGHAGRCLMCETRDLLNSQNDLQ
jgi:hypothetical protein